MLFSIKITKKLVSNEFLYGQKKQRSNKYQSKPNISQN